MPCILCQHDVKLTERILLEDCSLKTKQFYESNYFTNWEFNYLCRGCYWRDFFRRTRGNIVGFVLTLGLRFGMVYAASLAAWSFLFKYKYQGDTLFHAPVVFAALTTLVFYQHFLKILMAVVALSFFAVAGIYGAAYSDSLSFLPPMGAVVAREQMKQRGITPATQAATAPTATTTTATLSPTPPPPAPIDPVVEARLRDERARQARVDRALKTLEHYLPFYIRIDFSHLRTNIRPACYGFGLLHAILFPWHFLFVPLWRWWRNRRQKRR